MSTLTATPDPETGTIALTVDDAANYAGIIRADNNGTRPVRARADQLPAAAGARTITDYEPALAGLIQYTLLEVVPSPTPPAPVWAQFPAAMAPRFILPSVPQFAVTAELVHGYSAARKSRSTFHEIIGRNDAIVAEGRLTPRTGTLDVWLGEYIGARNLESLLERGQAAMYRQAEHAGMDMYFHVTGTDLTPDEGDWKLSVGYQEIDFPSGNVMTAAGWTFDKLKLRQSFYTVARDYRTFNDLAIGQTAVPE